MAEAYFHWFFLTRPGGLPERLIGADPAAWVASRFAGRHGAGQPIPDDVLAAYLEAFARPGVVEATCADYRAAATSTSNTTAQTAMRPGRPGAAVSRSGGVAAMSGGNFDVSRCGGGMRPTSPVSRSPPTTTWPRRRPTATVDALRAFWGMRA